MSTIKLRVKVREIQEQWKSEKSDFSKTSIIGVIEGEYPEVYKIDFNNKKQELLDELVEGCFVTIKCNLRGREVEKEGRVMHFLSLEAYGIENINLTQA